MKQPDPAFVPVRFAAYAQFSYAYNEKGLESPLATTFDLLSDTTQVTLVIIVIIFEESLAWPATI